MSTFDWPASWLAPRYLGWLFDAWLTTLWVSALVIVCATLTGTLFAAGRSSARGPWRAATAAYVSVFRNTPLLVQLFFWYFGAPALLPEAARDWLYTAHVLALGGLTLRWPSIEFLTAVVGLVLYATAYVGEELRAGVLGVPAGQAQAATALGLTRAQVFRSVVMPQAVRIALQPLFGQYMNIVKNTSLAMAVGLAELSYASRQVEAETFRTFQAFGIATALYVVTIFALEWAAAWLVRRDAQARA